MKKDNYPLQQILLLFLSIITAIVVVFLSQFLLYIKSDLEEMKTSLSAIRAETVGSVTSNLSVIPEKKCTDCHSGQLPAMVKKTDKYMESSPDAQLTMQNMSNLNHQNGITESIDEKLVPMISEEERNAILRGLMSIQGF